MQGLLCRRDQVQSTASMRHVTINNNRCRTFMKKQQKRLLAADNDGEINKNSNSNYPAEEDDDDNDLVDNDDDDESNGVVMVMVMMTTMVMVKTTKMMLVAMMTTDDDDDHDAEDDLRMMRYSSRRTAGLSMGVLLIVLGDVRSQPKLRSWHARWKLRFEMQRFFLEVQGPKQKHGKRLRSEELAKLVERLAVVADWFWQACEGITGDPSALGHLDTFAGMLLCFNAAPLQD
ncbi:hypothetical protein AK812_SmicGene5395 [Symbiodinium microadriaticum]|uniref:Uncharacterized protein n=1 Tax=Symbiodinium microadriaticum TaxID=2951 RepID=A0A1Q9ETZ1_SYMMI|nr:hypothetical protein AK812_SmicGene5395 [Symbiodinium microadriaticum]